MRILVDTNLFLDVLLDREPFAAASQRVLDYCDAHPGEGWIAWHTLANLYCIGAKTVGKAKATRQIDAVLGVFDVCPAGTEAARRARLLPVGDFEDALQVTAAQEAGADWIVTRNVADFNRSPVPAVDPETFLARSGSGT